VPDHLPEARICPKPLKIVATLSTHCVQYHEAFYHGRFVETPVPLPNPEVFPYLGRQSQRVKGLHEQRHPDARTIKGIRWERAYGPFQPLHIAAFTRWVQANHPSSLIPASA
jgi:hypothetical protein